MKHGWRLRSIQTNIVLAFIMLILITIFTMSITSYYLSQDAIQKNTQAYTLELVKQVNTTIKSYVSGMEYMSNIVASNPMVQNYLAMTPQQMEQNVELNNAVSDFLQSLTVSRKDISSVNIVSYKGPFITGKKDLKLNPNLQLTQMDWYMNAKRANGQSVLSPSHVQPMFQDNYPWVVSLSRELQSLDGNHKWGILLVDLNFNVMNEMLRNIQLGQRGYLFIVDHSGQIVYHPQQQLIYSGVKSEKINEVLKIKNGTFRSDDGEDSKIYTVRESSFGWKVVGVAYVNELVGNQEEVRSSFIILGVICIVFAIGVAIYLSQPITRPLKQLQTYMKEVEKGNFDIQVPVPNTVEVARLARTFNIMVKKIKDLMLQTVLDQEQKRKSEMRALQAQINPHFLYNTLDSIIWMAESNKSREVVQMTSALAKLLRASISKENELVPISTEIAHIENYLTIQKMRYKNKLDYRLNIDHSVTRYATIKVILQPIVENAIYHGIKQKREAGLITIRSEVIDNDILLIVEDNGHGMDQQKLLTLLEENKNSKIGGVGVLNVHNRLQLYFGKEYGLSFESEVGVGTKVTIRIPKTLLKWGE